MVMGNSCDTTMTSKLTSDEEMTNSTLVILTTGSYQQQDCNFRVHKR
jgi:hypothetical protein